MKPLCLFRKFTSERGASMLEYALLAALISVVVIVAIGNVGVAVKNTFTSASDNMIAATNAPGTSGAPPPP